MTLREMLVEPIVYLAPGKTLEGLTPDQADQRIAAGTHSIAEILAHMTFWQDWFVTRCEGTPAPMVTKAALGWPAVTPGSWPTLHPRFFASLERAAAFDNDGRLDNPVTPAMEFPAIAHYTIRDTITHVAIHNAHHLGQIILLRQMLGLWPPPAGSWTW
jgi:uncharacterized damage-inducible protein DinB